MLVSALATLRTNRGPSTMQHHFGAARYRRGDRGGKVQGVGREGGTAVQMFALCPEIPSVSVRLRAVTKSRAHHLTAVLSKLNNLRMTPALDDFPNFQVSSIHGTRCIRVEHILNICRGRTVSRSLWWAPWLSRASTCLREM